MTIAVLSVILTVAIPPAQAEEERAPIAGTEGTGTQDSAAGAVPNGPEEAPLEEPQPEEAQIEEVPPDEPEPRAVGSETPMTPGDLNREVLAAAKEAGDAPFLHALALEAELDRDPETALELLRAANRLAPEDGLIAFDLARMALLHEGTDADLEPFWSVELSGAAAEKLRLAVANRLDRDLPRRARAPDDDSAWYAARLRTGLSVDSNIAITSDEAPSHLAAARLAASGAVDLKPLRDWIALDVTAMFDVGKYLDDSSRIERYDAATFVLGSTFRLERDPILLTVSANGTEIVSDNFRSLYLQSIDGDVDLRFAVGDGHIGVYAGGGGRDYGAGNDEDPTLGLDRDGPYLRAGLGWDWLFGAFGLQGRFGWAYEAPEGRLFQVQSAVLLLVARLTLDSVEVMAGVDDRVRLYWPDLGGLEDAVDVRLDNRLTPFGWVSVAVTEWIWVFASYGYTANISRILPETEPIAEITSSDEKPNFNYQRHLAQVGVEVRL